MHELFRFRMNELHPYIYERVMADSKRCRLAMFGLSNLLMHSLIGLRE